MEDDNKDQRLVGSLVHKRVRMQWTFQEDGRNENDGNKQWVFELRLGDISILRRYPGVLSQVEAEEEANKIAPELFQVAETWLRE